MARGIDIETRGQGDWRNTPLLIDVHAAALDISAALPSRDVLLNLARRKCGGWIFVC